MPKITFNPDSKVVEVEENTKLLVAATRSRVKIRFGCASCRCGTCGVAVDAKDGKLTPMRDDEKALLTRMKLPTNGTVRLACQARILDGSVAVDLAFQQTYSPDQGDDDEDDDD